MERTMEKLRNEIHLFNGTRLDNCLHLKYVYEGSCYSMTSSCNVVQIVVPFLRLSMSSLSRFFLLVSN